MLIQLKKEKNEPAIFKLTKLLFLFSENLFSDPVHHKIIYPRNSRKLNYQTLQNKIIPLKF